jgi:hypothetical protein
VEGVVGVVSEDCDDDGVVVSEDCAVVDCCCCCWAKGEEVRGRGMLWARRTVGDRETGRCLGRIVQVAGPGAGAGMASLAMLESD